MQISSFTKKRIFILYLISLFTPILGSLSTEALHNVQLSKLLSIYDEIFVVLLLCYSISKCILRFDKDLILLLGFLSVGFVAGIANNVPYIVQLLGAFSTIKAIIIYLCFKQIQFNYSEIIKLFKWICYTFYIFVVFILLELFIPNLKSIVGYSADRITSRTRFGFRPLSGIFSYTHVTLFASFFYFAFKYYLNRSKLYIYTSAYMIFATLKIKDIIGLLTSISFLFFKRIRPIYITIIAVFMYLLFLSYSILLPEHYAQYFSDDLQEENARPVLYVTSLLISYDDFPLGVGFGRFASPTSQQYESPVYADYGIDSVYGLSYTWNSRFMADTFWPMILGETGFIGLLIYVILLWRVFSPYIKGFFHDTEDGRFLMPSVLFILSLVGSVAKPVFSGPPNSFLIWGLAGIFYQYSRNKKGIYGNR